MSRADYGLETIRLSTFAVAAVFALTLIGAGVWMARADGAFAAVFGFVVAAVGALGALGMVLVEARRQQ